MIRKQDILDRSGEWSLRANVVEKDYVLGWILASIALHPTLSKEWVFKGGTCLKKCFFETFRFSEDLDFTILPDGEYTEEGIRQRLLEVARRANEMSGIEFPETGVRVRPRKNRAGEETFKGWIEYRGPLVMPGGPTLQLDLTRHERVFPPLSRKPVLHAFPDAMPADAQVQTYSIEELLAEKTRALVERTRPRDLYDVVFLLQNKAQVLDLARARDVFGRKCAAKGIRTPSRGELVALVAGHEELRSEWANMLGHQLPQLPDIETVIARFGTLIDSMLEAHAPLPPALAPMEMGADETSESAVPLRLWGTSTPLEMIRFAAANRLLAEVAYNGKRRLVEAYSLRRSRSTGNLLLHVYDQTSAGQRSFNVDKIGRVAITSQTFDPRWEIELIPGGTLDAPPTSRPTRSSVGKPRRPRPRR